MIPTVFSSTPARANGFGGRCAIPSTPQISSFLDKDMRGYGLLQRDRNFDHYQDLDLAYELRPSYFVEPRGDWGEGKVELVELPTQDEAHDNIVASFVGKDPPAAGNAFGYRITASLSFADLSPNGRVVNTFLTEARALGSPETAAARIAPLHHRFQRRPARLLRASAADRSKWCRRRRKARSFAPSSFRTAM